MPNAATSSSTESGQCDLNIHTPSHDCPHLRSGHIVSNSGVLINGTPVVLVGDAGSCNCPHEGTFVVKEGNPNILVNGRYKSYQGCTTECEVCGKLGSIISGESGVIIGE